MCFTCWEEMGQPYARTEATDRAEVLLKALIEHHSEDSVIVGEMTDWNLDDRSLQATLGLDIGYLERLCVKHLLTMSIDERASAWARQCGYRCVHEMDAETQRCKKCHITEQDLIMGER